MNIHDLRKQITRDRIGSEMHDFISELYPICRSITGNGVRATLRRIRTHIPLEIREVPSGTKVFDWLIPNEWNIRDAYIKDSRGNKIIDFGRCNLHVLSYSTPVKRKIKLSELRKHLFSIPEKPDWIPYRTSYYSENWGFCMSHRQLESLTQEEYEVCIDSVLEPGYLSYGEYLIPGSSTDEVLISCHICHPSLCNDNLSGIALSTMLAKTLKALTLRYSYRFLLIPGTIGSIAWLCLNEKQVSKIKHGIVLANVGDEGITTYKKSRRGNSEVDRIFEHILRHSGTDYRIEDFSPYGYDERQYCSPAFDLPVGCLMRTPHDQFGEYHTSADNLDFIKPWSLGDSFLKCLSAVSVLETNQVYSNRSPKCEPQLGRRGLYRDLGGNVDKKAAEFAMLWVLNQSDATHSLLDIAERSGMHFDDIERAAHLLLSAGLLEESTDQVQEVQSHAGTK